ncbi:LytTR family transcriptional regulator [Fibrella sp. HMF5335]|uniref:LytTR family transcriptional regulator n=1 Tax=Fibrella rubiginis TaxID=2817060 RepID=A0A939GFQ9_9BACT|nr:LytTR family DNA-binding domain-containing protein [Fibrella rubiginis]MBO0935955.1 LytTR family transcriptional regulator [Fibrella rubiginis]
MRNALALTALLMAIYLLDVYAVNARKGWMAWSPYAFLVLLYGWLVFHNRVLFEGLYQQGKRRQYAYWTALALSVGTINIWLILRFGFGLWPIPILIKYYLFTLTGLGVYVLFRQLVPFANRAAQATASVSNLPRYLLTVQTDRRRHELNAHDIRYLESLENYVRVITAGPSYLMRSTLKQVEIDLAGSGFLRISRSHLINPQFISRWQGDEVTINGQVLRIGRTYKQYVIGQLRQLPLPNLVH